MNETRNPDKQEIENHIIHYADKLRAGLLDKEPELKAKVEAVLATRADIYTPWLHLQNELKQYDDTGVGHQLRARRREVLQQAGSGRSGPSLWPQWATATAVTAILIAGATWFFSVQLTDTPAPTTQQVALNNGPELEELTENLDFYVWLDTHTPTSEPGAH